MTKLKFIKSGRFIRRIEYVAGIILLIIGILLYLRISGYQIGQNLLTGEWITYSSEKYQYSIQFPGRWRLYTSGDKGWHGGVRPYQRLMLLEPKPYLFGQIYFTIDQIPLDHPELESVAALGLTDKRNKGAVAFPVESIRINNNTALVRKFSSNSTTTLEAYIARECDGLILHMNAKSTSFEKMSKVFQQVIDKFTYENCSQPE